MTTWQGMLAAAGQIVAQDRPYDNSVPGRMKPETRRENLLAGKGIAAIHAAKTHCPEGHPYDVKWAEGRRCRQCRNAMKRRLRHAGATW